MRRLPYIGTSEEYTSCFRELSFTEKQKSMLLGHARGELLSMRQIAEHAGYHQRAGNSQYGKLAHKIRKHVGLPFEEFHVDALLTAEGRNSNGEYNLRIHGEVVQGLRFAGLLS